MRSNYKQLKEFISYTDIRAKNYNKKLGLDSIKGISSIFKKFIKTKGNLVGVEVDNYKIVEKNHFAYNPNTARMGDKIPIALNSYAYPVLVSSIYPTFKIKNTNDLSPEYLMMWFSREEFDRYARFKSHGSAREVFDTYEMDEVEIPIPSIKKQQEIVEEYKAIKKQIETNKKLIQNVETIGKAIFKQWFVDFNFLDKNNKEYLGNGGKFIYNEDLEKEIPDGWQNIKLKNFCKEIKSGGTPNRDFKEFWNKEEVPWLKTGEIKNNIITLTEEFISKEGLENSSAKVYPIDTVLISMYGVNAGEIGILKILSSTNQACCGMICKNSKYSAYLYFHLLNKQDYISRQSIGGAQENLNKDFVQEIQILNPPEYLLDKVGLEKIITYKENLTRNVILLEQFLKLILSKIATIEDNL